MNEDLRISFAERTTPEWRLARVVAQLACAAGVPLELTRMAGGEARAIAGVHEGMAEIGLNLAESVRWAYRAEAAYEGWRHTSLRALGSIWKPQWLLVATRSELDVKTLAQLAEQRPALRALVHLPGGPATTWAFLTNRLLTAHGLTLADLLAWGGRTSDCVADLAAAREGDFDLIIAPYGAHAGPAGELWQAASTAASLRFLGLTDTVAEDFKRDFGIASRVLAEGALPGVGEGMRALWFPRYLLYTSERLEARTARAIVEALAAGREELLAEYAFFDVAHALDDAPIRPHRGIREIAGPPPD